MYNDTVLDHLANPRNVGSLSDADGIGQSGNSVDGDKIKIYIKIDNKKLSDVKFKTFGCAAAIAASSMLTVLAMGKTLDEAMNITNDDVAEALGGLPPQKLSCSNIAADALHDAINDYFNKNEQNIAKNERPPENAKEKLIDTNQELKDSKQIQRYLRHIIMPKISGAGQKKIIQTRVVLCAQSIDDCDISLNYMAAAGIGQIYCYLENKKGCEHVLAHVRDLNPEVNIELIEVSHLLERKLLDIENKIDFNIFIGNLDFVTKINNLFIQLDSNEFHPTLIGVSYAWQGYINLCNSNFSIKEFLTQISEKSSFIENKLFNEDFNKLGISMSGDFIGALASVEIIKARLNIGKILNDGMYFNLLDMSFIDNISTLNSILENIQNLFRDWSCSHNYLKQDLKKVKVLIVGSGGLGSPNAFALAKAGVGTIGLIDFDTVDISNLNRQILHSTSKIGLKKVESAKDTLKMINQDVNIEVYAISFSKENAIEIVENYDIIVDGLDNIPTRYLLNDACFFNKKPLIEAGVLAFYGQVTTIVSGDGPCYRCIFPESKGQGNARSCSETGILGPVAGMAGILQAVEVLKMIIGIDSSLKGGLLMYDALETEFELIKVQKNNNCKLCGTDPSVLQLEEYTFFCKDTKK
jgi:molybdopterin/thiamine biosynthesis adenylyltransferase/NifU-like protein involved in Fe-S cluster formation